MKQWQLFIVVLLYGLGLVCVCGTGEKMSPLHKSRMRWGHRRLQQDTSGEDKLANTVVWSGVGGGDLGKSNAGSVETIVEVEGVNKNSRRGKYGKKGPWTPDQLS